MFSKFVVWGVPLHQHTNSYVYAGFHKAAKAMGFDAYWLNERSDISGMDFSNTLFLTEGQHDGNIPLRDDCKYVLHNCCSPKYSAIKPENKMTLQVYTDDAPLKWKAQPIGDGSYVLNKDRCLFQPWATDLLANEIDLSWSDLPRTNEIHWCGTIGAGQFGNENEINSFKTEATKSGLSFHYHPPGSTSFDENKRLIQRSYMAPAIHGTWQAQNGYIACRVFKNISYGHLGSTNSKPAVSIFGDNIVYASSTGQLFHDTKQRLQDKKAILEGMRLVREKHTYVNRIQTILSVM